MVLWYKFTFTVWCKRDSYKSLSITYTANCKRQIQIKNLSKQKMSRSDKNSSKQFLWTKKLHETTNMKSKRQGKGKLGHGYVRGTNSRLPLDVNVILETLRSRFAILPQTVIRGLRLAVSRYPSAYI